MGGGVSLYIFWRQGDLLPLPGWCPCFSVLELIRPSGGAEDSRTWCSAPTFPAGTRLCGLCPSRSPILCTVCPAPSPVSQAEHWAACTLARIPRCTPCILLCTQCGLCPSRSPTLCTACLALSRLSGCVLCSLYPARSPRLLSVACSQPGPPRCARGAPCTLAESPTLHTGTPCGGSRAACAPLRVWMPWGPALQRGSLGLVHVLSRTGRPCMAREAPVVSSWPFSLCALVAPRAVSSEALPPAWAPAGPRESR